jgi:hypothetical protein
MPGWIITGVRGEGKTLCAVGKIKEYALNGRLIATNLDLFLDKFLPEDNATLIYRLPDKPRLQDFELLPPAYDVDYKAEDRNGLLVLDELGTWLNSRSWNDKARLPMLNWLFLSRKLHWDIIFLAQDFEMIDAQVRNTICDYLVVSSRLDRQKIPYLAPIFDAVGINSFMPRIHRYYVFYGFNASEKPVDVWSFTGTDFYDGYNTNQRYLDGTEIINGEVVDMRSTYTYLPACYLSGDYYINKLVDQVEQSNLLLVQQINDLKKSFGRVDTVAKKKNIDNSKIKAYLLLAGLVIFVFWRIFSGGFSPDLLKKTSPSPVSSSIPIPSATDSLTASVPVSASVSSPGSASVSNPLPVAVSSSLNSVSSSSSSSSSSAVPVVFAAIETPSFMGELLKRTRPRLSVTVYSAEFGYQGSIDFYQNFKLVERFKISELHALGVAVVRTAYGADLLYQGKSYLVHSWVLPKEEESSFAQTPVKQPG